MLTVGEALAKVLERSQRLSDSVVPLAESLDHILAENVASDVDSPPHDKSVVDGYALRSADVLAGIVEFNVIEEVVAGQVPKLAVDRAQATRIMTGAPVPRGADAVVMLERTTLLPAESPSSAAASVQIEPGLVSTGQNIVRRGASIGCGDLVLHAGRVIRPIEIGVLAEVGRTSVTVIRKPTIAVLATGNELVPVAETPESGHIRNSNGPMLFALGERAGAMPIDLGVGRDDEAHLRELIECGLGADILVLSGGVSAGVLDLVPKVLAELGVEQIFHKVSLKPGKPLWFGIRTHSDRETPVFGLPGNPVSSLVCFELFVRPTLRRMMGYSDEEPRRRRMPLAIDFEHRGERPTYHPSRIVDDRIEPLTWQGSGDLRTLVEATALAHFPSGDRAYRAGDAVEVLLNI